MLTRIKPDTLKHEIKALQETGLRGKIPYDQRFKIQALFCYRQFYIYVHEYGAKHKRIY
jgi:hypothetical protein